VEYIRAARDKGLWQILVSKMGGFLICSMTISFSRSTLLIGVGHVFGNVHISTVTDFAFHGYMGLKNVLCVWYLSTCSCCSFCVVTSHHLSAVWFTKF
jgi:hypothetical protein